MSTFGYKTFVYSPSQFIDASIAISATRCGEIGIIDASLDKDIDSIFSCLNKVSHPETGAKGAYGIHLGKFDKNIVENLKPYLDSNLKYIIIGCNDAEKYIKAIKSLNKDTKIFVEYTSFELSSYVEKNADGIVVKGN